MSDALFLNATPLRIAVNLNSELDNHTLETIAVGEDQVTLDGWKASIEAYSAPGIFGAGVDNYLTVFTEGAPQPAVWKIHSTVSQTLGLFFYIMGSQVVGASQTGSTEGIIAVRASVAISMRLLRTVPMASFTSFPSTEC